MVKNPNWQEADQLTIYKHDRGVELGKGFMPKLVHIMSETINA